MNKHKHLEFIQAIVSRMAQNSFLIKGWAVTLVSALFALAAKDANVKFIMISYLAIIMFWILDGYFLSKEKQYRELYKEVKDNAEDQIDFSLDAERFNKGKSTWACSFLSITLLVFYLTIIAITLGAMFFLV